MARVTSFEKPRNSAARIVNIMIRTVGHRSNEQSINVWRHAFELSSNNDGHQVAELLGKLRKELQVTETALAAMEVPAHLYTPAVMALKSTLTADNLTQVWGNIEQGMAEHHVVAFRWAAHVLPDESHQIDNEDLDELKQLLAEFESSLTDATLPPVLHTYLSEQLVAMKAAIAAAVVAGTSDIKAAVRKAVADVHFNEDELKAEASVTDSEEIKDVRSKFTRLYRKSAEIAGDFDKISKGLKLVKDGTEWLMLQWDKIPPLS